MEKCRLCNTELVLEKRMTSKLVEKIYSCQKCKAYFINPVVFSYDNADENLISYYQNRELATTKRLEMIFQNFMDINPTGTSVLDIGSAMGYSGIVAKKFNLDYCGIEPNKILFENAINNFQVNVIHDHFPSDKVNQKFDFIILDNVLEHVYNPKIFFDEITQHLNPGGVLFLAVPPTDWLRVALSTSTLIQNAPEKISRRLTMFYDLQQHVNYFSFKSIQYLTSNYKDLNCIKQFHGKNWALKIYKLFNLTTGQFFIHKNRPGE